MSIVLENSEKETLDKAALEQSSSFIKGATGVTPYEAISTAGMIEGGAEALIAAPVIVTQIATQIATNVSTYAAEKLGKEMAEVLMPPTPDEISSLVEKKVSKKLKSAGVILKEVSSDSEEQNSEDAKNKQEEAINENAKKQKEKANAMKQRVQDIVANAQEECNKLRKDYIKESKRFKKDAEDIEDKAKERINEVIDKQVAKILEDKKEFIDGMAEGIAERIADKTNKDIKKSTKERIDKTNADKQKIKIIAKSKVGKALLNLMATLGM